MPVLRTFRVLERDHLIPTIRNAIDENRPGSRVGFSIGIGASPALHLEGRGDVYIRLRP